MDIVTEITIMIKGENILQGNQLKDIVEKIEKSFEGMKTCPHVKIIFT